MFWLTALGAAASAAPAAADAAVGSSRLRFHAKLGFTARAAASGLLDGNAGGNQTIALRRRAGRRPAPNIKRQRTYRRGLGIWSPFFWRHHRHRRDAALPPTSALARPLHLRR